MPHNTLLSPDFVRFLHERREQIVPFVGAGLSVEAGIPFADRFALDIAESANERGAGVEVREDFGAVCADVAAALGDEALQEIIVGLIQGSDAKPTPLLRLVARVPSQIVLTSNWDDALEKAAIEVGRTPRSFEPRMVAALSRPVENELNVIHIHGMASDPSSIILPGALLDALATDEAFLAGLRGLLAPNTLLYMGYRFPPEDFYLRHQLLWIAENMRGATEHALLLPESEYGPDRIRELEPLRNANFRIETFDSNSGTGYEAVTQAGLIVAPSIEVVPDVVTGRPDRALSDYFRAPRLVIDDPSRSREQVEQAIAMAHAGVGELPYLEPNALDGMPRVLLVGEPGAGKSELLLRAAAEGKGPHLYVRLPAVAAQLLEEEDIEQAFPRALRSAASVKPDVPLPRPEALAANAYTLLLDAFDEITEPETRLALAARLDEIVDRWPQNSYVIATRPVPERVGFAPERWTVLRLMQDASWGRDYLLETRGIPERRLNELLEQFPRVGELIAVPLYAALIGERLAREEELPSTALRLITDVAVHDALAREAELAGLTRSAVYRFLKTLATAMELRALNQAPADELIALPAPEALARERVRERLIQQSLLRDVEGIAEFQAVSVQEALAAEAILETTDPVETLRRVALVEVAGQQVLRPDIDHTLDLLFESAPAELRARLREIDELRWARTQPTTVSDAEAEETLRFIWSFFTDLRIWVDSDRGRELRDARAAVERLAKTHPAGIGAMRDELGAALRSDEETTRGNAVFFLDQLENDPERADWLRPRLADNNQVVRRWAAESVRRHNVVELRDTLTEAYLADREESAAGTLGVALLSITPAEESVATARILIKNPLGWSRMTYYVKQLPPADIVSILQEGDLYRYEDEHLLTDTLEETPVEAWDEDAVENLVALVVSQAARSAVRSRAGHRIAELAHRHPEAAFRGAARGASDETMWIDVFFLEGLSRELLEAACEGHLAEPIQTLLDRLDYQAQHPPEPEPAEEVRHLEREREEPRLADWIERGEIHSERCVTVNGPLERLVLQVDDLPTDQRELLTTYARAWWPEQPLRDAVKTNGREGTRPACFEAALAFHAALDLDLDEERWLDIYESNGLWFERSAAKWLARHYPGPSVADRVVTHIQGLTDAFLVQIALDALPEISAEVAGAAAQALAGMNDDSSYVLDRFRLADQLDALRHIEGNAANETTRKAARRELAAAGDLEAQRAELACMRAAIADGADLRYSAQEWLNAASADLLPDIEETFVVVAHRVAPSEWDIGRAFASVLERLADERGVEIYTQLMADPDAVGGSFYWHQRDTLTGVIAQRKKLAELPKSLREVAELLVELGYEADA